MGMMASQITNLTIVYSNVYSGTDQRKYQRSTSLAFVMNSPHTGPVTKKMFPFDDVITPLNQGPISQRVYKIDIAFIMILVIQ